VCTHLYILTRARTRKCSAAVTTTLLGSEGTVTSLGHTHLAYIHADCRKYAANTATVDTQLCWCAPQTPPRRTPNTATPRHRLGCCADQTQNITDISTNTIDILTNTIDIFKNITDILSLFRG
jgi:hypothetical protein